MATFLKPGPRDWRMIRDGEGHRIYKLKLLVVSTTSLDGPATVLQTPGLPVYGSVWAVDNDVDLWAWCKWDAEVTPAYSTEPGRHWEV